MKDAIIFDSPMEAIKFTGEIDLGDGKKGYVDIPQEQFVGNTPMNLTLGEAIGCNIDLSQLFPPAVIFEETNQESAFERGAFDKIGKVKEDEQRKQARLSTDNKIGNFGIKNLPKEPLQPAKVYENVNNDRKKFIKSEDEAKKVRECLTAVKILDFLKLTYSILIYSNDIYIFNKDIGVYQYYSNEELDRLINMHFGEGIKKEDNISLYYFTREYLKREHELVVQENHMLPLNYWPFRNGFLNITTGELIRNDGQYFVRHVLNCNYNPNAECPNFDCFIHSIAGGDAKLIKLLWQTIGYLLSLDMNGKVFFSFIGKKDTGKSLLAKVLTRIIGEKAVSYLSASNLSGRFDVSNLNGKHLNVCMDLPNKKLSLETIAKIKMITGGDTIYADVKNKQAISFRATARLLFGCNSMIQTEDYDVAFNERHVIIPFNFPVPKEEQDFYLEEKLLLEAEGICRKAMEYYKELVKNSYRFPQVECMIESNEMYDYEQLMNAFVEQYCEFTDNNNDKVPSAQLHTLFKNFCFSLSIPSLDITAFSRKFKDMFRDRTEKTRARVASGNVQVFLKVQLKSKEE